MASVFSSRFSSATLAVLLAGVLLQPECGVLSSPVGRVRDDASSASLMPLSPSGSGAVVVDPTLQDPQNSPSLLPATDVSSGSNTVSVDVATEHASSSWPPTQQQQELTLADLQDPSAFSLTGTYEHPIELTITANAPSPNSPTAPATSTIVTNNGSWAGQDVDKCDSAYRKLAADQIPGSMTTQTSTSAATTVGPVASQDDCDGDTVWFFDKRAFVPFKITFSDGHYFVGQAVNPSVGKPYFHYLCDIAPDSPPPLPGLPWKEQDLGENEGQPSILCGGHACSFFRYPDEPSSGHKRLSITFQVS